MAIVGHLFRAAFIAEPSREAVAARNVVLGGTMKKQICVECPFPSEAGAGFFRGGMMNKPAAFAAFPIDAAAAILIAVCGLGACGNLPPGPILKPIDVKDPYTTIPSARLSWYPQGFDTGPRALNWGVELEYARGIGRSDQTLGSNEFISLGGNNLLGPQQVHHHADLRYGHVGLTGSQRFGGRASALEIEWVAGVGYAELNLISQSRVAGSPALFAKQEFTGVALGVGPRWNITNELALEGRVQLLHFWPFFEETLWYPEIAVRYRPAKAVALRLGYSSMTYDPSKQNGSDSAARIQISGPFLALHLFF